MKEWVVPLSFSSPCWWWYSLSSLLLDGKWTNFLECQCSFSILFSLPFHYPLNGIGYHAIWINTGKIHAEIYNIKVKYAQSHTQCDNHHIKLKTSPLSLCMPQLSLSLITVNYSKLYLCCNYLFTTFSAQFRFISEKRWLNNFQVKRFTNTQVMSRINTNISFKKLLFRGNSLTLSLSPLSYWSTDLKS